MSTAINIGNKINKKNIKDITKLITKVYDSANKNNIDSIAVRHTMDIIPKILEVKNISISDCNIRYK